MGSLRGRCGWTGPEAGPRSAVASTVIVLLALLAIGCRAPTISKSERVDIEDHLVRGKYTLIYFGAEWCPPCHNLKINYFTRPAFIDAIQRFVPVYLDGILLNMTTGTPAENASRIAMGTLSTRDAFRRIDALEYHSVTCSCGT